MSYGAWNQEIRDAFPAIASCTSGCSALFPAAPARIRSPFGETAAFDPSQDQWAATWTGGIEGYRNSAIPTRSGRGWTVAGPARPSWRSNRRICRACGSGARTCSTIWRPAGAPASAPTLISTLPTVPSRASPWFATLSTAAGHWRKGLFQRQRGSWAVRRGAGGRHTDPRDRSLPAPRPHGRLRSFAMRRAGPPQWSRRLEK